MGSLDLCLSIIVVVIFCLNPFLVPDWQANLVVASLHSQQELVVTQGVYTKSEQLLHLYPLATGSAKNQDKLPAARELSAMLPSIRCSASQCT